MGFWALVRDADTKKPLLSLKGELFSGQQWWDPEDKAAGPPDDFRDALSTVDGEDLTVYVESQGGNLDVGMGLYTALKARKGRTTTKVPSIAFSAATLPVLAGSERQIGPGALYMIHDPYMFAVGSPEHLREAADELEMLRDAVANVYADETGLARTEVLEMMADETWLNARSGVKKGFFNGTMGLDEIKEDAYMDAAVSREGMLRTARMAGEHLLERVRARRQTAEAAERAALLKWAKGART